MQTQSTRSLAIALLSGILFFSYGSAASESNQAGAEAVAFVFDITHADTKLRDGLQQAAVQESPDTAQFMEMAWRSADVNELRRLLSAQIISQTSSSHLKSFTTFVDSPAGQSLRRLAVASRSVPELVASVGKLPKAQQQAINSFMSGPAFKAVISAISSPSTIAAARAWGGSVACQYAVAHPDQYDAARAISLGKCPSL